MNVVLIDDQMMMREGLRLLVEREGDGLTVVAQASSLAEAKDVSPDIVDVVVTDVALPDERGPKVVATLAAAFPRAAVLVLSTGRHPSKIQEVLAAGAHGYLLKTAAPADLVEGIRAVARGETYLQPSLGVELARWSGTAVRGEGGDVVTQLSAKEEQVLRLVAMGHTNNEMARLLSISLRTVETHRTRLSQKLGRRTRAELVRFALEAGLVDFGR